MFCAGCAGPGFEGMPVVGVVLVRGWCNRWGCGVGLFLVFPRMLCLSLSGVGGGVSGLLVENCIVDASILKRSNF